MASLLSMYTSPVIIQECYNEEKVQRRLGYARKYIKNVFKDVTSDDIPDTVVDDALVYLFNCNVKCNSYTATALASFLCVDILGTFPCTAIYLNISAECNVARVLGTTDNDYASRVMLLIMLIYIGGKRGYAYRLSYSNLGNLFMEKDHPEDFDSTIEFLRAYENDNSDDYSMLLSEWNAYKERHVSIVIEDELLRLIKLSGAAGKFIDTIKEL